MWPFLPRHSIIGIVFSDTALHISQIKRQNNAYQLHAHTTIPLECGQIIDGIPFQLSTITSYIMQHINTIKNPTVVCAIDDKHLHTEFTNHIPETNTTNVIICHESIDSNHTTLQYAVGIRREHLFYYQLLTHMINIPCPVITTVNSCYITTLSAQRSPMLNIQTVDQLHEQINSCNTLLHTTTETNHVPIKDQAVALGLYLQGARVR